MNKEYFIERIIKHSIDNKGKIMILFSANEEKIHRYFLKTQRIFRKKIHEGYDVSPDYYLIDFYTYMMICEGWGVLDLYKELVHCNRGNMAITKHLQEVESTVFFNYISEFIEKYDFGL